MTTSESSSFKWDDEKDNLNRKKNGVPFILAQYAFADTNRVILEDIAHSTEDEKRYFCVDKIGEGILTVRFT